MNALIRHLRAPGERAAGLKERWRAAKRLTLTPNRIDDIARTALVLNWQWE
ncbi:hypothetical protein [Streptacidiphilus sp. PAMC 29251]